MDLPPNLCYTIALDQTGQDMHRRMGRLLVTSLIRTQWHGRIVVFRNGSPPVLPEGHPDVEEIVLDAVPSPIFHETTSWKYLVRDLLDITGIGKVLFLDCDIIALRSINHLMFGNWDIFTGPEPGRIIEQPFNGYLTEAEMVELRGMASLNSGNMGIRAAVFQDVMAEWERVDKSTPRRFSKTRDQHSWNRLILDTKLRHRPFAKGELQFPFLHKASYLDYRNAALVHAADQSPKEKFRLLYPDFANWRGTDGGIP